MLLFSALAFAQQQQPPAGWTPVDTKLVYQVPGMDKVRVIENEVYKTVGETQLKADVYIPAGTGSKPAVVLVSGGSDSKHWGLYKDYGRLIAARDVVAVIFDKRFPPGPQAMETGTADTADVLKYIRANAAKYNIDANRVCVWTFSAGGTLAQLGINPENGASCVVAYYGMGQAGPRIALQQHAATMPPMLIVRAGRDNPNLNNAIDVFSSMALMMNAPVSVINYPQGLHAFEVEDFRDEVKTPANREASARLLDQTLAWIAAHAKPRPQTSPR